MTPSVAVRSRWMASLISSSSKRTSSSSMSPLAWYFASILCASSTLPLATRKRGLSGMNGTAKSCSAGGMTWMRHTSRHDHDPLMLSAPKAVHAAMMEPTYQHVLMSAAVWGRLRGCATSMAYGPPDTVQNAPPNPTIKRPASILYPPVVSDCTRAPAMMTRQPMVIPMRRPRLSATHDAGISAGIPPRLMDETFCQHLPSPYPQ